jgi:hypothetical protein
LALSPHPLVSLQLALRADDSEGEFDDNDESFAVPSNPVLVAVAADAVPEFQEESEEEGEEDQGELDEEEELLVLQELQKKEEAESSSDREGSGLEDSEAEEEAQPEEITTTEANNDPATDPTPALETADQSSQSEDGLVATQLDEVEAIPAEELLSAVSSAPSTEKVAKKAKNSMYAQLLREEERQAKKQVDLPSRPVTHSHTLRRKQHTRSSSRRRPKRTRRRADRRGSAISVSSFKRAPRMRKRSID